MAEEKVFVKAKSPVKYGDTPYGIGDVFEVDEKTYKENEKLFDVVDKPKEEETDGEPRDTKKSVNKKTAGDSK